MTHANRFRFHPGERESLQERLAHQTARFHKLVVAIDGPGGAGKSTTARAVANRLGLLYLDTGAMYRALTLAALRADLDLGDSRALARMAHRASVRLEPDVEQVRVLLDEEDVTQAIRSAEVTRQVSRLSAHAEVRREMVRRQRASSTSGGVVLEGRDIGTVVLPDADLKIFLTADRSTRAERRRAEEGKRGLLRPLPEIEAELARRDHEDETRKVSPLVAALDAIHLDTTELDFEEQRDAILALVLRTLDEREKKAGSLLGPVDPENAKQEGYRPYHSRLFWWVQHLVYVASRLVFGLRVVMDPSVRLGGSVIVASNHISGLDPFYVGGKLPFEMWFVAKRELFRSRWLASLIGSFNAIPIHRGTADYATLDRVVSLAHQGRNVFMFLEGTRQPPGRLGRARWGFGYVAARSGRPIVPAFVRGSRDLRPRGLRREPLEVWIGEPVVIEPRPDLEAREHYRQIGALVMARIEGLMLRSAGRVPLRGLDLPGPGATRGDP